MSPPNTMIRTCPTNQCLIAGSIPAFINVKYFRISFLGCYKTNTRFVLQVSNPGGTFDPVTDINNVPQKLLDMPTLPASNTTTLSMPTSYFPTTGIYKLRMVIYAPLPAPTITYSPTFCNFTITRAAFKQDCPAGQNRVQGNNDNNDEIEITDFAALYPNPTTDRFTLQTPEYDAATEVSICDTQGRLISTQNVYTTTNEIETHELPNGVYYVRIAQGERSTVLKLVIMK